MFLSLDCFWNSLNLKKLKNNFAKINKAKKAINQKKKIQKKFKTKK